MRKNNYFLKETSHRPWTKPTRDWQFFQLWEDILFLHFEVDLHELQLLVPDNLPLDSLNNKYYISVVAFKMKSIKPAHLPTMNFISDFNEIQIRTYVVKNNKPGIYFINLEVTKRTSAFVIKLLSGLPYGKSEITRTADTYKNINNNKGFYLEAQFSTAEPIKSKTLFDTWVTERYAIYIYHER